MIGPATLVQAEGIATITMNDPARRNALGPAMLAALMDAFAAARTARAVVLRASAGHSVWCAGFDIGALRPGFDPLADNGPLKALFAAIEHCPAPVIAQLNGTAWGGGTDLALRCDIAVGSPATSLAFTPAKLGLPYDPAGLANVLLRAGMTTAIEMFATAEPVRAERALAAGLLNHVVPEAELDEFVQAMARRIAANAPLSVASAKAQLRALNATVAVPQPVLDRLLSQRRAALDSEDYAEGMTAFREKRRPTFSGR